MLQLWLETSNSMGTIRGWVWQDEMFHKHLRMEKLQLVPPGQLHSFPKREPFRTAHCSPASHWHNTRYTPSLRHIAVLNTTWTIFLLNNYFFLNVITVSSSVCPFSKQILLFIIIASHSVKGKVHLFFNSKYDIWSSVEGAAIDG